MKSMIKKFFIKFNQRAEINSNSPSTSQAMRLRSGHVYGFESHEADDDTDEVQFIQEFQPNEEYPVPMQMPLPMPMRLPYPRSIRAEGRAAKTMRCMKWCCNVAARTAWRIIRAIPSVLTATAGVHVILQSIYPPEQKFEIKIIQNSSWW